MTEGGVAVLSRGGGSNYLPWNRQKLLRAIPINIEVPNHPAHVAHLNLILLWKGGVRPPLIPYLPEMLFELDVVAFGAVSQHFLHFSEPR